MKKVALILLITCIPIIARSQETKEVNIIKILDSNLFLTKDSILIKLSYIDAPKMHSKDSIVAKKIINYASRCFLNKSLHLSVVKTIDDTFYVELFKKYPLNKKLLNTDYLENGYGSYTESDKSRFSSEYENAEKEAKREKRGIWNSDKMPPTIYKPVQYFILFKYTNNIKNKIHGEPLKLRNVTVEKHGGGIGFKSSLTMFHREWDGEEAGEADAFLFSQEFSGSSKYLKFQLGIFLFLEKGGEGPGLITPVGEIEAGFLDKLTISFDFVDESLLSFGDFSINYIIKERHFRLGLGKTFINKKSHPLLKVQVGLFNLLLFDIKAFYNFKEHYGAVAWGGGLMYNF